MRRAEEALREALAAQTLADVKADIDRDPATGRAIRAAFD
ncbi:hypothetical protein GCM10020220_086230 [Nonomuraea rubra]